MKYLTFILIGVVIFLTWKLYYKPAIAKEPEQSLGQKKEALELKEKCAIQSGNAFTEFKKSQATTISWEYTNHYNLKLNKCFLRVDGSGENLFYSRVSEAFEKTIYGNYVKNNTKDVIVDCWVTRGTIAGSRCKSELEFETLLDPYLEMETSYVK